MTTPDIPLRDRIHHALIRTAGERRTPWTVQSLGRLADAANGPVAAGCTANGVYRLWVRWFVPETEAAQAHLHALARAAVGARPVPRPTDAVTPPGKRKGASRSRISAEPFPASPSPQNHRQSV